MPDRKPAERLDTARAALSGRIDFAAFLAKLSPKDRLNIERRVGVLAAAPAGAELWQRLVCSLATLAPHAAKCVGKQNVQFYIADGRYRMQVFAIEDLQDGNFTIYCPDVISDAIVTGVVTAPEHDEGPMYRLGPEDAPLHIRLLDGNSANPGPHFKDMVGWNRKAIQITLPPSATPAQVEATELLCAIAAQFFAPPAAADQSKP